MEQPTAVRAAFGAVPGGAAFLDVVSRDMHERALVLLLPVHLQAHGLGFMV